MSLQAQIDINWTDLSKVKYTDGYDAEEKLSYNKANFDKSIRKLNEKEVLITGFVIPLSVDEGYYALSKNPFNTCFFCSPDGSVGPETVMELRLKKNYAFETDDIVTFKGKLKLNENDLKGLYYSLEDAQVSYKKLKF